MTYEEGYPYKVREVDPDAVVLRPEIVDTRDNSIIGGWSLNDWERVERFAAELNEIEGRRYEAGATRPSETSAPTAH